MAGTTSHEHKAYWDSGYKHLQGNLDDWDSHKYWLWRNYPIKDEKAFSTPSKCFAKFLKRDNPFIFIDKDIYDYCLSNGVIPLHNAGGVHDYTNHDSVNLYLARASIKDRTFYKVGLTLLKDPIKRDSKVYKEIVRCKKIPAGGCDIPYIYEQYILWRCKEQRYEKEDDYDEDIFKKFGGKTEVVHTQDPLVEEVFDHHFNEITSHLKVYTSTSILLEIELLKELVKSIYDDEFASAELIAKKYFDVYLINSFFGSQPSSIFGPDVWVGLPPRHIKAFERYCKQKIAPLIDSAWNKLDMADPKKRGGAGSLHYSYWGRRKGRTRFDIRPNFSAKSE